MNNAYEVIDDSQDYGIMPKDGHRSRVSEKNRREMSSMNAVDVMSGVWQSDLDGLLYIITQVGDRFTWRVMHKNGDVETGTGKLFSTAGESMFVPVEAQWNVYSAQRNACVRSDTGYVRVCRGRAYEIQWANRERFFREK